MSQTPPRILVIGAAGQLGTDLCPVLAGTVRGVDWPEYDVTRADAVQADFAAWRPGVVINCAAQTNVDACEDDAVGAFAVNALGAYHVARAAAAVGALVVYISTDYVFGAAGAERTTPYVEGDLPGPINVYGASKLAGEQLTQAYAPRALIVRTCGLYGHAGARGKGGNFVETMLRLGSEGGAVRVVDDQRLTPTSTMEVAQQLVALVAARATGVAHVAASDACSWHEFAREIFTHAGLKVALTPITSAEYPTRARRPAWSALGSTGLSQWGVRACRPWRVLLHEYLDARAARRG